MTRMTGPDCVVMCNLINTYIINTYMHTYIHTYSRVTVSSVSCVQNIFFQHDKRRMRAQEQCFVRSVELDAHDFG